MDELGEVMAGFNVMSADLEKQRQALQRQTSELEHRVQERTMDLSRLNENLMHF